MSHILPTSHAPEASSRPALPGNWVRFAHLPLVPRSPGSRPSRCNRELGSFGVFALPGAPISRSALWQELALFV
jgi:hypothetical protein